MTTGLAPAVDIDLTAVPDSADQWVVLLHNDDINDLRTVVLAVQAVFGYDSGHAEELVLSVHETGKDAVWTGDRQQAETYVVELGSWSLSATLAKDT